MDAVQTKGVAMIDENKMELNNGNFLCRFCFDLFTDESELAKCEEGHIQQMKEDIKIFEGLQPNETFEEKEEILSNEFMKEVDGLSDVLCVK